MGVALYIKNPNGIAVDRTCDVNSPVLFLRTREEERNNGRKEGRGEVMVFASRMRVVRDWRGDACVQTTGVQQCMGRRN